MPTPTGSAPTAPPLHTPQAQPAHQPPQAGPLPTGPGRGLTLAMAAACGLAVANIYYNQPLLGIIARDFPRNPTVTGFIPTATQMGYALGLFALVPLGDLFDRRRLIVAQFLALALALGLAALAPGAWALAAASVAVGAMAAVAQQVVPLAASLAAPEKRGATVGTVMSGLLCGILFSRTLAGVVGDHAGWRAMFAASVGLALAAAGLMAVALPASPPTTRLGYGSLMRSLGTLWRLEPTLRRAAVTQGAMFGAFSAFWAVLALHLEEPRFHLGATAAGLFGVVAAVGVFAAPLAGRQADRRGPRAIIVLGAVTVMLSWLLFGLWNGLPGLIIGVILMDFGLQSALVAHQHVIYALQPAARSRINTLFMTVMFLGGAFGSAGATLAWDRWGWPGVCVFAGLAAALALLIQVRAQVGERAHHP